MNIQLDRFFGPKAFRSIDVLKSFENSQTVAINPGMLSEIPSLEFLSIFHRLECLIITTPKGGNVDFNTLPSHVQLKKKLRLINIDNVIGLSNHSALQELELIDYYGSKLNLLKLPPALMALSLSRPVDLDLSSLSHSKGQL